ncbi:hypothetical protein KY290_001251 [Solanum tuberosum]|uniref:Uncharacterized protein n=1 Tax=Solanum tuberosum TaxID=4113 RepID=A0ABQ7WLQ7_SOLTU|nr:hypothetical protein KY290_001251 [Solanum tuberosum]
MTYGEFPSPSLPSTGKLKKQSQAFQHRLEELRNLREQIRALAREIQSVTQLIYGVFMGMMIQTLDILQDYLELRKYSYEHLDGSIHAEECFAAIKSFSHNRSKFEAQQNAAFVFLI